MGQTSQEPWHTDTGFFSQRKPVAKPVLPLPPKKPTAFKQATTSASQDSHLPSTPSKPNTTSGGLLGPLIPTSAHIETLSTTTLPSGLKEPQALLKSPEHQSADDIPPTPNTGGVDEEGLENLPRSAHTSNSDDDDDADMELVASQ